MRSGVGEGNFTLIGRWERIDAEGDILADVFNSDGTGQLLWYGESSSSGIGFIWSVSGGRLYRECLFWGGHFVNGFTITNGDTTLYIYRSWWRRTAYTRVN